MISPISFLMHSTALNFLEWSVGEPKPIITASRSVNYLITCAWWAAMTDLSSCRRCWVCGLNSSPCFLFSLGQSWLNRHINHFFTISFSVAQSFRCLFRFGKPISFQTNDSTDDDYCDQLLNVIVTTIGVLSSIVATLRFVTSLLCIWRFCAFNPFA